MLKARVLCGSIYCRLLGLSGSVSAEHSLTLVPISARRRNVARESGLGHVGASEAHRWAQPTC